MVCFAIDGKGVRHVKHHVLLHALLSRVLLLDEYHVQFLHELELRDLKNAILHVLLHGVLSLTWLWLVPLF